jgi:hypothetical protein
MRRQKDGRVRPLLVRCRRGSSAYRRVNPFTYSRTPSVTTGLYSPSGNLQTSFPVTASTAKVRRASGFDSYREQEPQLEK